MKNEEKVYIILVNYKNWLDTIDCIESILQNNYRNYQIVIVDNNSNNDSVKRIIHWINQINNDNYYYEKSNSNIDKFQKARISYILYSEKEVEEYKINKKKNELNNLIIIIQSKNNYGFAAGNNIAIKYILKKGDCRYILLLNNDTIIESHLLEKLITAAKANKNIGIVGAKIFYYNKKNRIWFNSGKFNKITGIAYNIKSNKRHGISYCSFITGCCMLIKLEVIEKIGLLNENYFMYVEDLDFSYKALKNGFLLAINHDAVLWHKIGSSNSGEISEFSAYWMSRNIIKFNRSRKDSLKNISIFIYIIYRLITIPKWIIKEFNISKAILKGIIDGLYE